MISRRDVAGIDAEAEAKLLAAHGLTAADLIGQGTEAKVYGLDPERVLKVYADPGQRTTLKTLQDFYGRLTTEVVPFALPSIESVETHGELLVVIERRINGVPMENFVTADGRDLEKLYVNTVKALSEVRIEPPLERHMLLAPKAGPIEDWNGFLGDLIIDKLPAVLPPLRVDVPGINQTVKRLIARLEAPYRGPVGIIHGDLYPGNILMSDETTVAGVIDFGTFTMIGDPLFDVATACGFYRMYEPDRLDVRQRLLDQAAEDLGADRREDLLTYLLAGALLSCDLYPEDGIEINATGHFQWAAEILREGH